MPDEDDVAQVERSAQLEDILGVALERPVALEVVGRQLLAAGADAVAGHSAHVFHGVERLADGLVVYDLGDALDDYAVDGRLRNDLGLLALWKPGGEPGLELVGLFLDYCHTHLARGEDADWIAERLSRACAELGTGIERTEEQKFRVYAAP